jgi:hypothetical protein
MAFFTRKNGAMGAMAHGGVPHGIEPFPPISALNPNGDPAAQPPPAAKWPPLAEKALGMVGLSSADLEKVAGEVKALCEDYKARLERIEKSQALIQASLDEMIDIARRVKHD